jgi:hypothetical protein
VLDWLGVGWHAQLDPLMSAVSNEPGGPGALGFSTSESARGRHGRYHDDLPSDMRTMLAPLLSLPMRLYGYEPDPWPEVEPFFAACHRQGVDAEIWRDKVKSEARWFEHQQTAFLPTRKLEALAAERVPLLVDGAVVSTERTHTDAHITDAWGQVRKQDRQITFRDPQGGWPALARALDGTHTLAALREHHGPGCEALLERLTHAGFVGWLDG